MESIEISFVTWPDGKVDGASLTVCGETMAIQKFIAGWLPEQWFGDGLSDWHARELFRKSENKGLRVVTITMKDGEPRIKE